MTNIDIYQGNQIGGCVTVITAKNGDKTHRIMIDYGESLQSSDDTKVIDYPWDEAPVDAVFFTHYHEDHVGRMLDIPDSVDLYLGDITRKILGKIHKLLSKVEGPEAELHKKKYQLLCDDKRVHTFKQNPEKKCFYEIYDIPFFVIEPYRVDHSAYDAYMFLIEAQDDTQKSGKKVIVHTGDFRGHGRLGKAMSKVIDIYIHKNYGRRVIPGKNVREVDVLIIEGTLMNRTLEKVKTEKQLEKEAEQCFQKHSHVFLICSVTNLDSLASFYRAWRRVSGLESIYTHSRFNKELLMTYSDTVGRDFELYKFNKVYNLDLDKELPQRGGNKTKTQKEYMKEKGFLALIKPEKFCEKYIEAFMDCDDKPIIIYSLWDGYLNRNHSAYNAEWDKFLKEQEKKGIGVIHLHTSGHATPNMIAEVIKNINPLEKIIPIHTECSDKFTELDIGSELRKRIQI